MKNRVWPRRVRHRPRFQTIGEARLADILESCPYETFQPRQLFASEPFSFHARVIDLAFMRIELIAIRKSNTGGAAMPEPASRPG